MNGTRSRFDAASAARAQVGGRPRFDPDALRELAGEKVFARGEAYFGCGHVQILALAPERVLAQVAGTEPYRVRLTGSDTEIGGECDCPAFGEWGFCKHMVATALAANAADGDAEAEGAGVIARIRDHLKAKSVDALVEMIMELAEQDAALFRRLDISAAATQADEKTLEVRLRKAIDGATRTRGFVEYREVPDWAAEVDAALDVVADLAPNGRAGLALKLVERAIDRIEEAVANIDDSDGHCGALLSRAHDIHLAAAREARPEPVQLARSLFNREMADDYGTFVGTAAVYADVLGEEGLAEYRRLAAAAWRELPLPVSANRESHCPPDGYYRLRDILDLFAERDGDVETRIALRAADLSSSWSYLNVAEFCLSQGRNDEALRWAEEGLWVFEDDRPDERLVLFAVELLSKAGRTGDAEAHLQRAFEMAPSLELYLPLRACGGEEARERALRILEARLDTAQSTRWTSPADLLIRVLMHEKMFDAAWQAARKHGASMGVKEALALASESTHSDEAIAVYAARIDQLANAGGNPAYAEAAALLTRMAALRSATAQTAHIDALKARFGRKRNFMKLLA